MGSVSRTIGLKMQDSAHVVFFVLIVAAYCQASGTDGKFFQLQQDGSIQCRTKEDCPDDIPFQANNTVLEFRCTPRATIGRSRDQESRNEMLTIVADWYLNQKICGEEHVNICCTNFAAVDQCVGFDLNSCSEEGFNGVKPPYHAVTSQEQVRARVPRALRGRCRQHECMKNKRSRRRRGVIKVCCDMVKVRGTYACPPRPRGNTQCRRV